MKFGFRIKILLLVVCISTIAMLSVSLVLYKQAENIVETNFIESMNDSLQMEMNLIESNMKDAYDFSLMLQHDDELKLLIDNYSLENSEMEATVLIDYLASKISNSQVIESVYIYLEDKKEIITSDNYRGVSTVFARENYLWLTLKEYNTGLSPAYITDNVRRLPQKTMAYVRSVYKDIDKQELDYSIAVTINQNNILYSKINKEFSSNVNLRFLLTDDLEVAFEETYNNESYNINNAIKYIRKINLDDISLMNMQIEDDNIMFMVKSSFTDYKLFAIVDRNEIIGEIQQQQEYVLYITLVVFLISLGIAFYASLRVYEPMKNLQGAMINISNGDLSARATCKTNDEIGLIADGFNQMVDKVEELIEELVDEQLQKKEAELEALQYQITPHFMYNTLNSIKYAAYLQGVNSVGEQIGAFIELLQTSINKNGTFILFQDEIRMVKNYVKLQNFRYMDNIEINYDISMKAQSCYVPRLLLQPLVENSILHGQDDNTQKCEILISAIVENDYMYISVEDKGRGMTTEEMEKVMSSKGKKYTGFSGIGVANIIERLSLYYGKNAEFRYIPSTKGTKVLIVFPFTKSRDDYEI